MLKLRLSSFQSVFFSISEQSVLNFKGEFFSQCCFSFPDSSWRCIWVDADIMHAYVFHCRVSGWFRFVARTLVIDSRRTAGRKIETFCQLEFCPESLWQLIERRRIVLSSAPSLSLSLLLSLALFRSLSLSLFLSLSPIFPLPLPFSLSLSSTYLTLIERFCQNKTLWWERKNYNWHFNYSCLLFSSSPHWKWKMASFSASSNEMSERLKLRRFPPSRNNWVT